MFLGLRISHPSQVIKPRHAAWLHHRRERKKIKNKKYKGNPKPTKNHSHFNRTERIT